MNIISALGSGPLTPSRSRTGSLKNNKLSPSRRTSLHASDSAAPPDEKEANGEPSKDSSATTDERSPLLQKEKDDGAEIKPRRGTYSWQLYPKRVTDIIVTTLRVVASAALLPAHYVVGWFFDEYGEFSIMLPLRSLFHIRARKRRRKMSNNESSGSAVGSGIDVGDRSNTRPRTKRLGAGANHQSASTGESNDSIDSESIQGEALAESDDGPARNTRSKTGAPEPASTRSTRIKIQSADAQKQRHSRHRSFDGDHMEDDGINAVANALKSPPSPAVLKLKYPRAPAPPRPLIPRRQPSYANMFSADAPRKTLILDLDETLIHSMAKGGRMSTGHMVEIKFRGTIQGAGGNVVLGPQVPILYYVHERPYCHEFLRKVCKWYNLVIFTASVQEYADPVIDWLERERAYFVGRYYRQHCTFRNGAYIKDLSQVEADLSKVMILDNSPMSYIFHEDNAIPIEGWISDPTDNDLLHLVPFLEGLQYVTDVRALLALRMGQQRERGDAVL